MAKVMVKDVADQGYKLDLERVKEVNDQIGEPRIPTFAIFIPIINLAVLLVYMSMFAKARALVTDQLFVLDCLKSKADNFIKSEKEQQCGKPNV